MTELQQRSLLVVAGLALSFVASGTEAAVASIDRADRKGLSEAGGGRAVALLDAKGLDTSLIVSEVVTSLGAAIVAIALLQAWLHVEFAVCTAALLVAFNRATAQALGAALRLSWLRRVRVPLTALHWLLWPVRGPLCAVTDRLSATPNLQDDQVRREAEFLALVEQGRAFGAVDQRERDLVEAVFEFGEFTVGRLMTPRPEIIAVPLDIAWPDLVTSCQDAKYSRVPVYGSRADDVVGVLMVKDLLPFRAQDGPPGALAGLRRSLIAPRFVPQNKPASAMLREFLATHEHMAFVVDEHGTLVGLITLDDLLGELVGEMLDHDDLPEEDSVSVDREGWFRAKGWLDLEDFHEETGIRIAREGFHTLGGFVFHHLGRLPVKGDFIAVGGYRYVVVETDGRRILEVQVEAVEEPSR